MIQVENLTKSFGRTRAVDDLSFTIAQGEVVGFLGPNGAGKTTTMRLITNYLLPDAGRIEVNGFDVEERPLEARSRIGYLPESAPLYHDLTVAEHLAYIAAVRGIPRGRRAARAKEMLKQCGLEEVVRKKVGALSKGYRQRVGLAQTLIHDPGVLILDEPTTGLDPNQIKEIRDLIRAIAGERTIVISTHILSEVQATCSRVLIINNGGIVADGTPEGLSERLREDSRYQVRALGDATKIEQAFHEAPFIVGWDRKEDADHRGVYLLRCRGEDPGEALFSLAVSQGFVLAEIRREKVSLEAVFSSLTLGEEKR